MPSTVRIAIASMVVFLVACARAAPSEDTAPPGRSGQAALAERLYAAHCAACHDQGVGGAPKRAALEALSPDVIKAALSTGVMKAQAKAAGLNPYDIGILSERLGKGTRVAAADGPKCGAPLRDPGAARWNGWGNGSANARLQSAGVAGLDARSVGQLELAWAFGFPGAQRARSQPLVTANALYVGSQSGHVYALDPRSGCLFWTYAAGSEVRTAPVLGNGTVYFVDFEATVHALDPVTGKARWTASVKDHPDGTGTGSLAFHGGTVFVPMSSTEVLSAYDDAYECCTFRGGVTALDAASGKRRWRWYSTAEPRPVGRNRAGTQLFASSGAPVWSTPTIDARRGLIYVGTGENYSSPANGNSDARFRPRASPPKC